MSVPQNPREEIPSAAEQMRLGALMRRLDLRGDLDLKLKPHGLVVSNPASAGCCGDNEELSDTITCKRRPEDGHRLWFFTSWGEPIAEADHTYDAAGIIASRLRAG